MADHSAGKNSRLTPRVRLFGLLMLGMGGWITAGVAASAGSSLRQVSSLLPPSLSQALTAVAIVGVVCLIALVVAGIGTLLGYRQALVLGSLAAAVYSGAWLLGAAMMPWRPAVLIEGILLLVLIGSPMLAGVGTTGARFPPRLALILVLFWTVILGMYAAIVGSVTTPAVRALAARPLGAIVNGPAIASVQCRSSPRHPHLCVPDGYQLKTRSPQVSAWRAPSATALVAMSGTVFDSSYRAFGFPNPFAYEQAVWNSHIHPGLLVVIKGMVSDGNGREELYRWATPRSRGFLTVRQRAGNGHWFASAEIYPAGAAGYTLMSQAPEREQALAPLLATIAGPAGKSR